MSDQKRTTQRPLAYYFVDEAGDLTLFDKKGNSLVGTQGVSAYFMVGFADLMDVHGAQRQLDDLRAALTTDPYFRNVPSMNPQSRKTALSFHAKDDLPEVRYEVFKILRTLDVKVQVAVRRKVALRETARRVFETTGKKLTANDIYDDLVKRLFRNNLHKADRYLIWFARRGKLARKEALEAALRQSKRNFAISTGRKFDQPTDIQSAQPSDHAGLQVIDYYLWALQRLYERGEDRYFEMLRGQYRIVMDLDDKRNKEYGEWYTDQNPLTADKLRDPQTD